MDKFKMIIVFIIIISIILICVGIKVIVNKENDEDIKVIDDIYVEQVEDLVIENDIVFNTANMMLISDKNTFYTLEKIVKEFVTNVYNEDYNLVLGTISKEFFDKSNKSKIEEKLEKFNKIVIEEEYNIDENSKILYEVYERVTDEYDCLLNVGSNIHYLLVYLDKDNMTYEIRDFILAEEVNE